jgi:RNA polymerase sigma factor (TIGR02999 family)
MLSLFGCCRPAETQVEGILRSFANRFDNMSNASSIVNRDLQIEPQGFRLCEACAGTDAPDRGRGGVQGVLKVNFPIAHLEVKIVLSVPGSSEQASQACVVQIPCQRPRLRHSSVSALTFLKGEDTVFVQNRGCHPQRGLHVSKVSPNQVTGLLLKWKCGDQDSLHVLLPLVYSELRLAEHPLRGERIDHTLQSTGLVHEAYLRLVKPRSLRIESRGHFLALASQLMREILVDVARSRSAAKRDAGRRLALDEAAALSKSKGLDLRALDDCLNQLSKMNPRQGRIVEGRFFVWVVHRRDLRVSGNLVSYRRTRVVCRSSVVLSGDQEDGTS